MKAALAGIAATVVIAIGAYFVLDSLQLDAAQKFAASQSVRLDR
jgi:uncharacterized protein YxeA